MRDRGENGAGLMATKNIFSCTGGHGAMFLTGRFEVGTMLYKVTEDSETVTVSPSLLGWVFYLWSSMRIRPCVKLNRDFGPGYGNNKSLVINGPCHVTGVRIKGEVE